MGNRKNDMTSEVENMEENQTTEMKTDEETEMTEAAPKQPEMVEVYVPKGYSAEDHNLLVSINGKNYVLPRGKKVKVPAAVANEIARSERAQQIYDANVAARVEATKNSAAAAGLK